MQLSFTRNITLCIMIRVVVTMAFLAHTGCSQTELTTCLRALESIQSAAASPANPPVVSGPVGEKDPKGSMGEKGERGQSCREDNIIERLAEISERFDLLDKRFNDLIGFEPSGKRNPKGVYRIEVRSTGYDDGYNAFIRVNGTNEALSGRGHWIVVINPRTAAITSQVFDTYGSNAEVKAMIRFLEQVEYNSIVAIAIQDATNINRFDASDREYLESLGIGQSGCPLEIAIRDSFAMLTLKTQCTSQLPDWFACQHVPRFGGAALVEATVNLDEVDSCDGGVVEGNKCIRLAYVTGSARVNKAEATSSCSVRHCGIAEIITDDMQARVETYIRETWSFGEASYVNVWLGSAYETSGNPYQLITLTNGRRITLFRWHPGYPATGTSHGHMLMTVYKDPANINNGVWNSVANYEGAVPLCAFSV